MNSIQYTIRRVPKEVDTALRLRAKKGNQSFNATVVEVLSQATQKRQPKSKSDLAWFYGSGGIGKDELAAFADQRKVDRKAWD